MGSGIPLPLGGRGLLQRPGHGHAPKAERAVQAGELVESLLAAKIYRVHMPHHQPKIVKGAHALKFAHGCEPGEGSFGFLGAFILDDQPDLREEKVRPGNESAQTIEDSSLLYRRRKTLPM